ncbi:DUF6499 domain-containing protein [Thiobacillus sp.]|uniref:transcriptional regulator domain-containing protein n=1 Tax=Thiobacillus sp. TaxID=924 RepID=UPI00182FE8FB|nr:DUF6499 domain-containing protein [Thiobacillus sp.]MBC2731962.1 hypothetical protein [Thiobacillus sp.]MBC2740700.1 hypothetical protein [Thiobacillus sp.]MBC2759893.1 hypothetical protein [Thiobacillus sp.]
METDAYAYCAVLTRDQWAWEFLRRNPDYRSDYRRFITLWHALEADYSAPPNRDFSKWKLDPRAYGPLPGDVEREVLSGELCVGDDDRVLLECWMGAKWGFYKFPLDPERGTPPGADELSWRPPLQPAPHIDEVCRLDVSFDLSLPLPPQLEAAKFRLVGRAAELRRQGILAPKTVANQCARWIRMLRVLDGDMPPEGNLDDLREAQAMTQSGYLDILRLADAGANAK